MAEGKEETRKQNNSLREILRRAELGENRETESTFHETKQNFYQPSGAMVEMTIVDATLQFMNDNYSKFGEESLSFPEQAVDYGLSTQALVLTDDELDQVAERLDGGQKYKFEDFMKTKVKKGAVSEIEVFNFAKKSENKLLMALFWSFDQSCLQKLMGTEQTNQEMDVIILLAKQRKFIVIEVKSDHSGRVPTSALTTLKHAKTFVEQVFKILGIQESECWEYVPLIALPNVESRDKIHQKYCAQLDHILTQTEFKKDLLNVIQIKEDVSYEDVSSYKKILSLLAASYHSTAVKKGSIGGVQFVIRNLVLEASRKLAGVEQIQAGFEARGERTIQSHLQT